MKKNALLIIDGQNDFCDPTGSLYVPGAEKDMERIAAFIERNGLKIDYIGMTQDSHQVIDISHPSYWQDKDGNFAPPFTVITSAQANAGEWTPRYMPKESIKYLQDLETDGKFVHVVWPEHCVIGSVGAAIYPVLMDAVKKWAKRGKFFQIVQKGQYPTTEHFGVFKAQIPVVNEPSTQLNQKLIQILEKYDNIFFVGEAKSHCTATSLQQAMEFPELAKKFIVLDDCMSDVPGGPPNAPTFAEIAQPIYDEAVKMGIQFTKSVNIDLGVPVATH